MMSFCLEERKLFFIYLLMPLIFLMWGLITVLNGFYITQLLVAYELNYAQAIVFSMIFFVAYLFISIPAGKIIAKVGFRISLIFGLLISAAGCFALSISSWMFSFSQALVAFFILGSGITILQVGANSYMVLIGKRGMGAQRLTFTQAFNSVGTLLASIFAAKILSSINLSVDLNAFRIECVNIFIIPYLVLGITMVLLAIITSAVSLPKVQLSYTDPLIKDITSSSRTHVLEFHHVTLGCLAIFFYVGIEISLFRFLLLRMDLETVKETSQKIDLIIKLYWGGFIIGRFVGSALLSKISPRKMITASSVISSFLLIIFLIMMGMNSNKISTNSLWIIASLGLFNSILFPCVYTMGMDGLGKFSEEASSFLIMSIVGGAIVPFIFFELLQVSTLLSLLIIILSYMFIAFFGAKGSRYDKRTNFY